MTKEDMSVREFQLTEPLVFGCSKKMIAAKFHLSVYTVETTVKNAYAKIGASNLAEYIMWYYAVTFDIAKEINEKKKEVLSIALLLICMSFSTLSSGINLRRSNARNLQAQASLMSSSRLRSRRRERREDQLDSQTNTVTVSWTV